MRVHDLQAWFDDDSNFCADEDDDNDYDYCYYDYDDEEEDAYYDDQYVFLVMNIYCHDCYSL